MVGFGSMQDNNLNFPTHSMSAKIKTNQNILSFHTAAIHMLKYGKIQILILYGAKAIKMSVFLDLLTVQIIVEKSLSLNFPPKLFLHIFQKSFIH